MKNRIYTILALALFWIGCDQREIPLYDTAEYYIEFENETVDSTIFTFIYYPNDEYYDMPIGVKVAGVAPDRDLTYTLHVDEEFSTATSAHYSIPETMTFQAGRYHDTCYVRLNKTADLEENEVRLVLRLDATEDMGVGKLENAIAIIRFSNMVARPDWWDSDVEQYYLGTYSQKKFILFLEVVDTDLSEATDSEIRNAALRFKQYLIDHEGEPETIDEDGQPMTVPVLGLE